MKVALIGATGYTGKRILTEAVSRKHRVTAIARKLSDIPNNPSIIPCPIDIFDTEALSAAIAGQDAVLSAFNPGKDETGKGVKSILDAVRRCQVRLLVVGGAGSLEVAPGRRLIDEPDFPAQWKPGALKTAEFLEILRKERDVRWTFISPAANLSPGQRTARYRTGGDQLLKDESGKSQISVEDYAVAMLDELESAKHICARFCVAY